MTYHAFAGGEAGRSALNQGSGVYNPITTSDVLVTPNPFDVAAGDYAYSVAPLNGNGADQYGWAEGLRGSPNLLTVMFKYRFTTGAVTCLCNGYR